MKIDKKTVGTILTIASGCGLLGLAYAKNPWLGFLATLGLAAGLIMMKDD